MKKLIISDLEGVGVISDWMETSKFYHERLGVKLALNEKEFYSWLQLPLGDKSHMRFAQGEFNSNYYYSSLLKNIFNIEPDEEKILLCKMGMSRKVRGLLDDYFILMKQITNFRHKEVRYLSNTNPQIIKGTDKVLQNSSFNLDESSSSRFYSYYMKKRKPDLDAYFFPMKYDAIKKNSTWEFVQRLNDFLPEECIFIDDKKSNVEAAKKCGIKDSFQWCYLDGIDALKHKLKSAKVDF